MFGQEESFSLLVTDRTFSFSLCGEELHWDFSAIVSCVARAAPSLTRR